MNGNIKGEIRRGNRQENRFKIRNREEKKVMASVKEEYLKMEIRGIANLAHTYTE